MSFILGKNECKESVEFTRQSKHSTNCPNRSSQSPYWTETGKWDPTQVISLKAARVQINMPKYKPTENAQDI